MSGAGFQRSAPEHCGRCGRKLDDSVRDRERWIGEYSAGFLRGYVCPNCQTAEEANAQLPPVGESKTVILADLSEEDRARLILDGIWQRLGAVVNRHKELAVMAGETRMAVNAEAWIDEALNGWPLMDGMPEEFWGVARKIAADNLSEMLGGDQAN